MSTSERQMQLEVKINSAYIRNEVLLGNFLISGKRMLGHGGFVKWLDQFPFSRQTAAKYMRAAREYTDRLDAAGMIPF